MKIVVSVLLALVASWSAYASAAIGAKSSPEERAEVPLVVFNREIVFFRAPFLGVSPATRASRARLNLEEALSQAGDLVVSVKANPEGQLVMLDDKLVFVVTAGDVDVLRQETAETVAQSARRRLEQVVAETRESRNLRTLLMAATASTIATLVFFGLIWVLARLRAWLAGKFLSLAGRKAELLKIGGTRILEEEHLFPLLSRLLTTLGWVVITLLAYEWLSFILSRFPYTRPWGEQLNDYLLSVARGLVEAIIGAVPGMGIAIAIFFIARFFIGVLGRFFERSAKGEAPPGWLCPDTMPTTRRLFAIGIWLFAIAMAYPYLPGAQTDAFKGLSVLLGLMVSMGASSVVGQGAAGLILTYTQTIRRGEYVRIGEHEGTVMRVGMFTTTVRTGLGEELTIPNAVITGNVSKNYSRTVQGHGFVVDTTVTIGYDTPWRQVEAMLIEAAKRTPGIVETPPPRVFQTALSDYYPEYRLVGQAIPSGPQPRAEVMTLLHANIQDVFNEYGVQIMSPHYMADPAMAKIVPQEDWYPAPARRSGS